MSELRFECFCFLPPPLQVVFALFLLCLRVQSEGCVYRLALNADAYNKGCCVSHHGFWHQGLLHMQDTSIYLDSFMHFNVR